MIPRLSYAFLFLACLVGIGSSTYAQDCRNGQCPTPVRDIVSAVWPSPIDTTGIVLNPGETLVSINGVPVNQAGPLRTLASLPGRIVGAVVNSDARAFAHAQREADLQAQRGRVGHLLGTAPGCRASGVGSSGSTSSPNHCTFNRTLVARAYAIGRNGKVYWSAHYR